MKTLTGDCAHLLLRRGEDLKTLSVELLNSTDEAISKWDWTTRSSPIFPFVEFDYPDWTRAPHVFVFFIGPLDPGAWTLEIPAYCSLGIYNIVAVCDPAKGDLYDLRDFLEDNSELNWEAWELKNGVVVEQGYGGPCQVPANQPAARRAKVSHGLVSAEEESATLFAASIAKSRRYMPEVADDLTRFVNAFQQKIELSNGDGDNTKLSWLVNVNAALSRFTSQTFSGVSPIHATESHFWTHSLLGVGLATQALVNIRRFTETAVGAVDWIDLLDQLSATKVPAEWKPLYRRVAVSAQEWADAEALMEASLRVCQKNIEASSDSQERLPLIVCFSGRDGFRSTSFSLSAPLEVISACNAYGWTPVTLSHEISHVWINAFLATIFPDPADTPAIQHMNEVVQGREIRTILDDLRLAVYFTYTLLEREREGVPVDAPPSQKPWLELVETHGLQVNETLTHILDYQFFYHQDETRYIKSIWASWDVIPNIKERIQSYLIRSACALLSERISHDDSIESTLKVLEKELAALKAELGHANYLDDALAILSADREVLRTKVRDRQLLVRIAKVFLANRPIAARLDKEIEGTGGVYSNLKPLVFDFQQILNPMRFLGNYCKDRKGDRAKSLWLMAKVAFMQAPHETFNS